MTGYVISDLAVASGKPWRFLSKVFIEPIMSFDEIYIAGSTGSCHFDNFQCNQWRKRDQNDNISISV